MFLARDSLGSVMARSNLYTITTAGIDHDQVATVLYAYHRGRHATEVRWKLPAGDDSRRVRLYGHPGRRREGHWRLLGTFGAGSGRATLRGGDAVRARHLKLRSTAGTEMTAERMATGRPLMVTEERLATIREQIEVPGSTLAPTWAAMLADVADP